jgi:predicted phage-related endonuclease
VRCGGIGIEVDGRWVLTITERQREQRTKGLGASDSPIALGLSRYKSPADLAMEKRSDIGLDDWQTSLAAKVGIHFEEPIARMVEEQTGHRLVSPTATFKHPDGLLFCNPDRFVDKCARGQPIVEIKWTSIVSRWGEPEDGEDAVPPDVYAQVCHQMACTDAPYAYVGAMLNGFGTPTLKVYRIERDQETIDALVARLHQWWEDHVVEGKPLPTGHDYLTSEVYKRVQRVPNKSVEIDAQLLTDYEEAGRIARAAKKHTEELKGRIIAALGDAECGLSTLGKVTFFEGDRKGYTVEPSTVRTLRLRYDADLLEAERNLLSAWAAGRVETGG